MKTGDIYFCNPKNLELWSDYPQKIELLQKITGQQYANKGSFIVEVTYRPKYAKDYDISIRQIWSKEDIEMTFDLGRYKV